jgi:hypothetical protein
MEKVNVIEEIVMENIQKNYRQKKNFFKCKKLFLSCRQLQATVYMSDYNLQKMCYGRKILKIILRNND